MLDYIRQQLQQGVSREQIKGSLMTNGWQAQDIEEGFSAANAPVGPRQYSPIPSNPSKKMWKILAGILIAAVVLGAGAYFVNQTLLKSKEASKITKEVSDQSPIDTPAEIVFADKLSSCSKYKTTFKHPFTGEILQKEILGVINGKCNHVEQLPNSGKMECKYTESERKAVAQYYKDAAAAESVDTSVSADLVSGKQDKTYSINDKVVDNPIQEALNSVICVISGY